MPSVATPQEAEAARRAAAQAAAKAEAKADHFMSSATAQITPLLLVKSSPVILQLEADAARREAEADAAAAARCGSIFNAAKFGNLPAGELARLLLEHQASITAKDNKGPGAQDAAPPVRILPRFPERYTPLDWASHRGHNKVAQILKAAVFPKVSPPRSREQRPSPLGRPPGSTQSAARGDDNIFRAARDGNLPAVRGILRQCPAAVHETLTFRRAPRRELLRERRAPSAAVRGRTPLHYAALYGHAAVVRLLLEHRASLEATDWHGPGPRKGGRPDAVGLGERTGPHRSGADPAGCGVSAAALGDLVAAANIGGGRCPWRSPRPEDVKSRGRHGAVG
eukprot:Skav220576  [mRNA]  locus=scaffold145:166982:171041:- [translate_table: standard]